MPKLPKLGGNEMFETIKKIIESCGIVVAGGAGFILTIKLLEALIALL